jgi:O-antigen/teichoic acid export membrane protein
MLPVVNVGDLKDERSAGQSAPAVAPAHSLRFGGRILARNSILNAVGLGVPMLVAVVAMPILLSGLGLQRFGVLALVWLAVGYFSVFDLGLGRALTRVVAERLACGRISDLSRLIWTGIILLATMGAVAGALISMLVAVGATSILKIPNDLRSESVVAFYLLAATVPAIVCTVGLRGVLEAFQRFDLVTAARLPLAIASYVLPMAVLPFSTRLPAVVGVLILTRFLATGVHFWMCGNVVEGFWKCPLFAGREVRSLLRVGGWITVSNLAAPLVSAQDRLLLGAFFSVEAVAVYTVPYEVVSKMLVVPAAVVGVLLPAFSALFQLDRPGGARVYVASVRAVFLVLFPPTLVGVSFAPELLALWLGDAFASQSRTLMQLMLPGILCSGLAYVPFVLIQGAGKPRTVAVLQLVEIPLFAAALWLMVTHFGLVGVGVAFLIRAAADSAALFLLSGSLVDIRGLTRTSGTWIAFVMAIFVLCVMTPDLPRRAAVFAIGCVAFGFAGWRTLLTASERNVVRQLTVRTLVWRGLSGQIER